VWQIFIFAQMFLEQYLEKKEFSSISFQQKISTFEKSRNWEKKKTGPKERNVKENMKDLSHLLMSSYKPKVGPQG
jgi:hypothetical protein